MEKNFGAGAPYTLGVEEEFQLVDPETRQLVPAVEAVLEAAGGDPAITPELSQSCLEVLSPVCPSAAELAGELSRLRERTTELCSSRGVRLVSAGAHPFSEPTEQPLNTARRYREVEEAMGWVARTQAIYGLHVHVAVPDEEAAIRAVNALARRVPLMISLSANSPFWRGSDTRLASTRIKVFEIFPRSGLPPAFSGWDAFESHIDTLIASGSLPDYTWCWWDARPHSKLGTVELRCLDAQTDRDRTIALAALTQCLVRDAVEGVNEPEDPLLTNENKWRAARYGLEATFYDFARGREVGARDEARELVERLRPVSQDLRCEAELEGVLEIVAAGNGAEAQRALLRRRGSLEGVVDGLADAT